MKTTQHILLCLLLWAFSAAHTLAAHTDAETKFIKAGSDFSALDVSKIPSAQLWMLSTNGTASGKNFKIDFSKKSLEIVLDVSACTSALENIISFGKKNTGLEGQQPPFLLYPTHLQAALHFQQGTKIQPATPRQLGQPEIQYANRVGRGA